VAAAPTLTWLLSSRWERFDGPSRLAGVDLARGLAVIGMLAAHLLVIEPFVLAEPRTWVDVVNGRSSILFATLAGVSVGLVTGARVPLRGAARSRASARIALRAGLLWVLGLLLVSLGLPVAVILPAYAILFLLSLPFLGLRPRTLFVTAGVIALLMPWIQAGFDASGFWTTVEGSQVTSLIGWHYPFPVWIAFLLAGLGIGRCDLRSTRVAGTLAAAGSAAAVLGYGIAAVQPPRDEGTWLGAVLTARAHSSGVFEVIGSGGFAVAVIGLCLLACATPLRWLAIPLRAVGAMPLTAYTAQLVVWAAVAASVLTSLRDLAGFRALEPFWPMTLGIVVGCCAWTFIVGRGPLEAAIDQVTRWAVRDPGRAESVDRLEP
jgi:uncharacterized membrane protein YeiB